MNKTEVTETILNTKPSSIRKYLWEYALIGLTGAVIGLFYLYINLNNYIRNEYSKTIRENSQIIQSFIINNQSQNK